MFAANFTYIAILIFFIFRLIFSNNQTLLPNEFIVWPWILFSIHMYLHHFFDGIQNTCRNIARIHLMNDFGLRYDQTRYQQLWALLIPNNLLLQGILWQLAHMASFISIMIYQGWGAAVLSEIIIWVLPYYIPINYQTHLTRIKTHLNLTDTTWIELMKNEFMPFPLVSIVEQAINQKLDPQKWWEKRYDSLVADKVENEKNG